MKKVLGVLGATVIALALLSCGSTSGADDSGKKEKGKKGEGETGIVAELNSAMALHMGKDWAGSAAGLNETSSLLYDAFTKSITAEAAAALVNENLSEYAGNIYEVLLVDAFNALNYYNQGDLENALVNLRRVVENQKVYENDYGAYVQAASSDGENNIPDEVNSALKAIDLDIANIFLEAPPKYEEGDIYRDSAFVRYLATVLYAIGEDVNAEMSANALARINSGFAGLYENVTSVPEDQGRIEVLSLAGRIAQREEAIVDIMLPDALVMSLYPDVEMAIARVLAGEHHYRHLPPKISLCYVYAKYPESNPGRLEVSSITVDGESVDFALLEDFDVAVKMDVNTKARSEYTRSVLRGTAKSLAALTAAEETLKALNEKYPEDKRSGVMAKPYDAAVKTAIETIILSETADVRQCKELPSTAYAGGINVTPGSHTVTVTYSNGQTDTVEVNVEAGKTVLAESVLVQ